MQKIFTTLLLLLFTASSFAQLSQGGFPLEIPMLKSVQQVEKVVNMPSFDLTVDEGSIVPNQFKSIKFAHTFEVYFTPENSGVWYETEGHRIWQLEIASKDAYSLNLIFSRYWLPDGARLFVFDPEKKVILGAFTHENNKPYKKFAVSPLPGDRLVVQYEEPLDADFRGEIEISAINHDYKGLFSTDNRWKRRFSQSCNIDVNCEFTSGTEDQRRSVCLVIAGDELGTGTLLNNVAKDGKPYVLSAHHVYDDEKTAETALYFFNYESPFCTGINGYDVQSVSGSVARAYFDSLDIMMVELSETPPAIFRPYYSGWDATKVPPSNSYTIHHPNGDTKKISHDTGKCDSTRYNKDFIAYGHWKVYNWETGTTEGGSSGAPLFTNTKRVSGILSGGNASCDEITYDLFSRFDRMWNYRKDASKQLKSWLDPSNTGTLGIDGYDPYLLTDKECTFLSNFMVEDSAVVVTLGKGGGTLTGNNRSGITEVAELFSGYEKASINGISIGVYELVTTTSSADITIRIYTGDSLPTFALKQYKYPMKSLTAGAMNFIEFPDPLEVEGNFFISVVIPENDSLQLYQSGFRPLVAKNSMYVMQDGVWKTGSDAAGTSSQGASLLMQVEVCGASTTTPTDTTQLDDFLFKAYPNPASSYLVVEFRERAPQYELWIYDMAGKLIMNECFENRMYGEIDVSGYQPGIYLLRLSNGTQSNVKRFVIN